MHAWDVRVVAEYGVDGDEARGVPRKRVRVGGGRSGAFAGIGDLVGKRLWLECGDDVTLYRREYQDSWTALFRSVRGWHGGFDEDDCGAIRLCFERTGGDKDGEDPWVE